MITSLLPSLQAEELKRALTEYLSTTFALTDEDVRLALEDFLVAPETGIFRGPYIRVRLPFRPAASTWRVPLDWCLEGFTPYRHQAEAFERLSSKHHEPRPTLVTTGTGSGKTESFLIPVIDHVLRAQRNGQREGIKALILYPMNALANDQALRLTKVLTSDERLAEVTAGLYTGEDGPKRTAITPEGLVTERSVMRSAPPDILLTNYKMLDQLLLRPEDHDLWRGAADSLRYVVLDEFHTYDGAQGTDVAMLLRRLGLSLGVARPGRPLGDVTPVATSATLGSDSAGEMLHFAETVFGCPFAEDSIVGEQRLGAEEWLTAAGAGRPKGPYQERPRPDLSKVAATIDRASDVEAKLEALVMALWQRGEDELEPGDARRLLDDHEQIRALVVAHDITRTVIECASQPVALTNLAAAVHPDDPSPERSDGRVIADAFTALLSYVRASAPAGEGHKHLAIDVQFWVREVSRLERVASTDVRFRWSDDGVIPGGDLFLPAIHCRHCGRSGWRVVRAPTGSAVEVDNRLIRRESAAGGSRTRTLVYAGSEAAQSEHNEGHDERRPTEARRSHDPGHGLRWFDVGGRILLREPPVRESNDAVPAIPVLVNTPSPGESEGDRCPACDRPDAIRFIGSGVATLASVTVSSLFSAQGLDRDEKKTLIFTDSVQDAAHRAGFVQARSHTLTLRSALRRALPADRPLTLPQLTEAVMSAARDDRWRRFELVPPALALERRYREYFEPSSGSGREAEETVRRRLSFDAALEFGLNSRTGRTLEMTGSALAEVDIGSTSRASAVAGKAVDRAREGSYSPHLDGTWAAPTPARAAAWVRGVAERVRSQGGIDHPWLDRYLHSDGARWYIWGGRDRSQGMPAFPFGRSAPAFPTTARTPDNLDSVLSSQSWYARWASRCLDVPASDGARLARALLEQLAEEGVLRSVVTDPRLGPGHNTVWALPPDRVLVSAPAAALDADSAVTRRLRCKVCGSIVPAAPLTIQQLAGGPCLRAGCPGSVEEEDFGYPYYQRLYASPASLRAVAAEHTSLLTGEVRVARESRFKEGGRPDDPNVLVATPTLELGIDIGDLTTVMLASLPRSTAAYQQRVGRAGRRTGNALVVALVPASGHGLPRLDDPLGLIAGAVRPPATYLDALEILQRQYVAHLLDRGARDGRTPSDLHRAPSVLGEGASAQWVTELWADARHHAEGYTREFLDTFSVDAGLDGADKTTGSGGAVAASPGVRRDTADALRRWAGVGLSDGARSGLEELWAKAARSYQAERHDLEERARLLRRAAEAYERRVESAASSEEDANQLRVIRGELRGVASRRAVLREQQWVQALEERGVLPNYSLLDDRVQLDVDIRWQEEDTGNYQEEPRTYQRASRMALTEFAPGSTFYAQGIAARVDGVDLRGGTGDDQVDEWVICPRCGWSVTSRANADAPRRCRRCGDVGVGDTGQRLAVLPLERVSSVVRRDDALISDSSDDRDRQRFSVVTLADVDPANVQHAWRLTEFPFGAEYVRAIEIRWLNVGVAGASGRERAFTGQRLATPLFRVCPGCGIVPAAQRQAESEARHRGWCEFREDTDIAWRELALGRTLRTQAVRLLVPPQHTADTFAAVSFRAALLLGLRAVIGGDPDHLEIAEVHSPVGGVDRIALLLHDIVPGGTGYLADFVRPDRVRELLEAALRELETCPCAEEGKLACHRCLLPFVAPSETDQVSRLRAVQVLREILGTDNSHAWQPEQVESISNIAQPSPESHLEQRFREVLATALRSRGAELSEDPRVEGTWLGFNLPGGRRWTLQPQPNRDNVRPDFVLRSPGAPQEVCIFTDGAAFHAAPDVNRVADDAAKRRSLRERGYLVWSVTSADLDRFERLVHGQPVPQLGPFTPDGLGRVLRASQPGTADRNLLAQDAVSQLLEWVTDPDRDGWQKLAEVAPAGLASSPSCVRSSFTDRHVLDAAADAVRGDRPPSNDPRGLGGIWRDGYGLGLAFSLLDFNPMRFGAALVVDDRNSTLTSEGGVESWRTWLRLSNVFGFADNGIGGSATIATLSEIDSGVLGPSESDAPLADTSAGAPGGGTDGVIPGRRFELGKRGAARRSDQHELTPEWRALVDTALDKHERAVLLSLSALDISPPELGYELPNGTPLEIAWPDLQVTVTTFKPSDIGDGWRVIPLTDTTDPQEICSVLEAAKGA